MLYSKTLIRVVSLLLGTLTIGPFILNWISTRAVFTPAANGPPSLYFSAQEPSSTRPRSSIAKVTMLFGKTQPHYERALLTHNAHNDLHGYPMYVLRERILPVYWSKPAYILALILQELAKPAEERLEWLFWADGDIIVMNHNVPLEIFIPPQSEYPDIHCLVTNDHRGLNNGAFFLRVHEWSAFLMSAVVSTKTFEAGHPDKYTDQSALSVLLQKDMFRNQTMFVPQRWFNAFAGDRSNGLLETPIKPRARDVRDGDLLVHFAGHSSTRPGVMSSWLDVADTHPPQWELDLQDTTYPHEVKKFWSKMARERREKERKENKKKSEQEAEEAEIHENDPEKVHHLKYSARKLARDLPTRRRR